MWISLWKCMDICMIPATNVHFSSVTKRMDNKVQLFVFFKLFLRNFHTIVWFLSKSLRFVHETSLSSRKCACNFRGETNCSDMKL